MAAFPDSAYGFIQTLCSFGGSYHEAIGHLVAVFAPACGVQRRPLRRLARARRWTPDCPNGCGSWRWTRWRPPRLADMEPANPALLRRETLALDATAVAAETFAQERTVGPAGVFRNMLMALVALVEKGSADQVQLKAGDALAFAEAQGWKDQQAVVTMLVAGALLKEQRFDDAIAAYRDARATAAACRAGGSPRRLGDGAADLVRRGRGGAGGGTRARGGCGVRQCGRGRTGGPQHDPHDRGIPHGRVLPCAAGRARRGASSAVARRWPSANGSSPTCAA